jgi:DNA-binding CsgD family transcriptional regulator
MANAWARRRAGERIEAISRASLDSTDLRRLALEVLREVVDFNAYVWLLTDPVTAVGAAPLAEVPCMPELPALIKAKYATPINRWTLLQQRTSPTALLDDAVDGDLARNRVWREVMSRYGVRDVASTVFADQFGCWGFLDLWRDNTSEPFNNADTTFINSVAASLTTALPKGPSIPASVYNVAAQLLAVEAGVDDHSASTRAHLSDGFWLTLRAARLASDPPEPDSPAHRTGQIVVTIEEASAMERLEMFARTVGLTAREYELLDWLSTGSDTRAMARQMPLSEHTIQDHLKSIFTKTDARDRVTVLSRALGTRGDPRAPLVAGKE